MPVLENTKRPAVTLPRFSIRPVCRFLALLALLLAALCADRTFAAEELVAAAPVLVVAKTRFEIGALVEGDPVLQTIPYSNSGDADLIIEEVKTDCACTTVAVDEALPPGGRGDIKLAIDTANHSGSIVRTIVLYSNDPLRPVVRLQIGMEITPSISVRPDRIFFDGVAGHAFHTNITFTANRERPLTLKLVSSNLEPMVRHDLTPRIPARSYRLAVTHTASTPGTLRGRLIFSTNYPMHPRITVPVFCRTRDLVEAVPARIDFGTLQRARYAIKQAQGWASRPDRPLPTLSCMLRLNRGDGLSISDIQIPVDYYHATSEAILPGKLYKIILTPRLDCLPTGRHQSQLSLKTDLEDFPVIQVPVSILVK